VRGVRVMLACEDYPALQDRHLSRISTEFPVGIGQYNAQTHEYRLHRDLGAGVLCFRNLDDASKYQSAEFAAIGVDELTKNQRETFDILRGSLRWPGISQTRFIAATNPGGPGHLWVKQLWIDRDFPPELADRADQFVFVRALPADNPHLGSAYWDELNSLPDELRRAWVEGDWNVFAGQAFGEWRQDRHVVQPFEVPSHWVRWRAVDYGFTAPMCCHWFAQNPDNSDVYVYRELYQAGMTDQEQAAEIVRLSEGERVRWTLADPSMWTKKSHEGLTFSTADEYAAGGVWLEPADNDRMNGIRRVRQHLHDGTLRVFANCTNLIRTLPALPRDQRNPEDVDTKAEDHAYDCLRYGLMRGRQTQPEKREQPDVWGFTG